MRNGQNKRMRGRNRGGKGHNPLTRVYESNGPDIKIRGTASHIAEKYVQLARDAQSSGDPVAAENYFQHAEHYFRLIAAAQEQLRQNQPYYRPENEPRDDMFDDGDDDAPSYPQMGSNEPGYGLREPQPYLPRDAQPFPGGREQNNQPREQRAERQQQQPAAAEGGEGGLPAFITGGQSQQQHQTNGHEGGAPDRFPLHRRRRRHRGPRNEAPAQQHGEAPAND